MRSPKNPWASVQLGSKVQGQGFSSLGNAVVGPQCTTSPLNLPTASIHRGEN